MEDFLDDDEVAVAEIATALSRLSVDELEVVHRQIIALGATSKREGSKVTASFWAAVYRALQREERRRIDLAEGSLREAFGGDASAT